MEWDYSRIFVYNKYGIPRKMNNESFYKLDRVYMISIIGDLLFVNVRERFFVYRLNYLRL